MVTEKSSCESIVDLLQCWFYLAIIVIAVVRAQVATTEQASTQTTQNVEAPVAVITGASRGIGRAIALSLGKAGCKVSECFIKQTYFMHHADAAKLCCFVLSVWKRSRIFNEKSTTN